jgi:hypothetical protein
MDIVKCAFSGGHDPEHIARHGSLYHRHKLLNRTSNYPSVYAPMFLPSHGEGCSLTSLNRLQAGEAWFIQAIDDGRQANLRNEPLHDHIGREEVGSR